MATKEKALEKLESLYGKANDSEKAIIDFLKVWIAEDESAAEKVGADKKTPGGAYNAMRDFAKGKSIQCLHGKEAWVQVMKYYGEDENSADQKLEHGLMFACIRAEMDKWKPYGADIPSVKSTPEPEVIAKNATTTKKAGFDMSLADFGL